MVRNGTMFLPVDVLGSVPAAAGGGKIRHRTVRQGPIVPTRLSPMPVAPNRDRHQRPA